MRLSGQVTTQKIAGANANTRAGQTLLQCSNISSQFTGVIHSTPGITLPRVLAPLTTLAHSNYLPDSSPVARQQGTYQISEQCTTKESNKRQGGHELQDGLSLMEIDLLFLKRFSLLALFAA